MPMLFQSRPGAVVKLVDPALQCATQLLGLDPNITFESERSIVTRVTVSQQVNVQFLHTLGAAIYIYVFGDRMGSITLSGLAFNCDCGNGPELGAEKMLAWYKTNRASKRKNPVRVTIGRTAIEGFVIGFTEDAVDPALNLIQWGATIASLPEDS